MERTWRRTGGEAPSSSCRSEVLREGGGGCLLPSRAPATSWRRHAPAAHAGWWGRGPLRWAQRSGPARAFDFGRSALLGNPAPSAEGVLVKEIQRGGGQALLRVGKGEERAAGRGQPRSSQQQTQRKPPLRAASAHSPHLAVERALCGPLPATSLAGPERVEIFNLSSRKSEGVSRGHSGRLAIGSPQGSYAGTTWRRSIKASQWSGHAGDAEERAAGCGAGWKSMYDLFQFHI